jgi:hypothetical protein
MRFYETTYEDYMRASHRFDMHPELFPCIQSLPISIQQCPSLILYGPSGSGKYTQALRIIERFSPSQLKYMKYMVVQQKELTSSSSSSSASSSSSSSTSASLTAATNVASDKEKNDEWIYRISDVHYEIDFALLGCESKKIWNECFFQIADIISMRPEKSGIILCRNFHTIHSELLNVFYSYMQHSSLLHIQIVFIILTEHLSFLPSNIIQCCQCIPVRRPAKEMYAKLIDSHALDLPTNAASFHSHHDHHPPRPPQGFYSYHYRDRGIIPSPKKTLSSAAPSMASSTSSQSNVFPVAKLPPSADISMRKRAKQIVDSISPDSILNLKEIHYLGKVDNVTQLPTDLFNIVCNNIIQEIECMCSTMNPTMATDKAAMVKRYADFRDALYDILLYGIDITECLWYILNHYMVDSLQVADLPEILDRIHVFLKYYNNNYRPIYHLESIFFFLIMRIHASRK